MRIGYWGRAVFTVAHVTTTGRHFTRSNGCPKRLHVAAALRRDSHAKDAGRKNSIFIRGVRNVRSEPVRMKRQLCTAGYVRNFRVIGSGHFRAMAGFTIEVFVSNWIACAKRVRISGLQRKPGDGHVSAERATGGMRKHATAAENRSILMGPIQRWDEMITHFFS